MKQDRITNLLLILFLIGLGFLLYQGLGGHLPAWLYGGGRGSQPGGFFEGLMDGVRSVGDGIGNAFGRLRP